MHSISLNLLVLLYILYCWYSTVYSVKPNGKYLFYFIIYDFNKNVNNISWRFMYVASFMENPV